MIELTAAVIGDDHAVDAALPRDARVGGSDQAFDHQLAVPAPADQLDMFPRELVTLADIAHQVFGKYRRAAHGIHVLKVRHAVVDDGARPGAEQPIRMANRVPGDPRRDGKRDLETVTDVVLAVRRNGNIRGYDEGVVARSGD